MAPSNKLQKVFESEAQCVADNTSDEEDSDDEGSVSSSMREFIATDGEEVDEEEDCDDRTIESDYEDDSIVMAKPTKNLRRTAAAVRPAAALRCCGSDARRR